MEYVQEGITTLHEFGSPPRVETVRDVLAETAIIVPMTERECESPVAERILSELEDIDPAELIVPVRVSADRIGAFRDWIDSFDLSASVLWCNSPEIRQLVADIGLDGDAGKGRDVWLAFGPATETCEYVVVHDADARSYDPTHVSRLLKPLTMGFSFTKGYYARVENGRLYGRLFRLFYEPLLKALAAVHDDPLIDYLGSFRYALAGEFAATADLIRRFRAPRSWGLEIGTLGEAFDHAGFEGTAQVDLGRHVHDHRAVDGESGLEGMSRSVAATLLSVLEERGVGPTYETLPERYLESGYRLLRQYEADAAFNGLEYNIGAEREQLERYAESIVPPATDNRLPPWDETPLEPKAVREAGQPQLPRKLEPRQGR